MDNLRNRWLRIDTSIHVTIYRQDSVNVIRHHYHRVDRYTFMVGGNILQNRMHCFTEWIQLDCCIVNIA